MHLLRSLGSPAVLGNHTQEPPSKTATERCKVDTVFWMEIRADLTLVFWKPLSFRFSKYQTEYYYVKVRNVQSSREVF